MDIFLPQIYAVEHPECYKLHLACWNQYHQPLDVFVRDRSEWDGWNAWRGARNDFSREFIFSLIDFYLEKDRWLFGGTYRVLSRKPKNHSRSYRIKLVESSRPLIGRLKIALKRPGRAKAVNFENHYSRLIVSEILPEPYAGEVFCGYDKIDIGFPMLENIIQRQRSDWKAALENAKGVYLITDTKNGRRYIGAAYGSSGIWSRWACYIGNGHGHNDDLTRLIRRRGIEYARRFFQFVLLEYFPMKTEDRFVIDREVYWKNALFSRGKWGYNLN